MRMFVLDIWKVPFPVGPRLGWNLYMLLHHKYSNNKARYFTPQRKAIRDLGKLLGCLPFLALMEKSFGLLPTEREPTGFYRNEMRAYKITIKAKEFARVIYLHKGFWIILQHFIGGIHFLKWHLKSMLKTYYPLWNPVGVSHKTHKYELGMWK